MRFAHSGWIARDERAVARLRWTESPYLDLGAHPILCELLRDRLRVYAEAHPASSMRVQRAAVLPTAPSLDHGEITDKGSVNQRAVLLHRSDLVTQLYQFDGGAVSFESIRTIHCSAWAVSFKYMVEVGWSGSAHFRAQGQVTAAPNLVPKLIAFSDRQDGLVQCTIASGT